MEDTTVIINSPKPGKVTIKYGTLKVVLTKEEYRKLIPSTNDEKCFFRDLKKNIKNYLQSLK